VPAEDGDGVAAVAIMTAQPGKEHELEVALRALVAASHADAGCVKYALHRAADDPAKLVIVEKWASQADLEAHGANPQLAAFGQAAAGLLAGMPTLVFMQPLAEGDAAKGTL
jgi:quinol monooxygenase YgiN